MDRLAVGISMGIGFRVAGLPAGRSKVFGPALSWS